MSRSTETLSYPQALDLLDLSAVDHIDPDLLRAAIARIETTVEDPEVDEQVIRDLALDLLQMLDPEVQGGTP